MENNIKKEERMQSIDAGWDFSYGAYNSMAAMMGYTKVKQVNLPHDYMLEGEVSEEAPAGSAMGYYDGKVGNYTKHLIIPAEWKGDNVSLHFDGVMMNASVEVNGSLVTMHHYGYTPFDVDITSYVYWGEENRITVTVNPSMQPNSRWYTGAGIYRHVTLVHKPLIHIATDGIYTYTKQVEYEKEAATRAFLIAEINLENGTTEDHLVKVDVTIEPETFTGECITRSATILVKAQKEAKARVPITVNNPELWDENNPHLYKVIAKVTDNGVFGVRKQAAKMPAVSDYEKTIFGIRTITADSTHGLRINGKTIKLKGGCIHHDNGILGAVSLYDSEERRLKKLKELGYNAVRMAHNPPSSQLLEACDRLGFYVFNEAFDAWGMAKQPGDYSQFFTEHWKDDMKAFITRDRNHPSVILWSTGNEIVERGGLGNGYHLATELAEYVRSLDSSRLVTNGLCSYWSGLDDRSNAVFLQQIQAMTADNNNVVLQNASTGTVDTSWEERSEAFVNALDVVGYNYLEDHYEMNGEMFPERVIVGTESYPLKMKQNWDLVEKLPYVIGDFAWTCYDYIGEAGIGKSIFADKDDPVLKQGPMALMSSGSQFPWRLANDADLDINGELMPQGAMRKILWGSNETFIYTQNPEQYTKEELVSMWGWPDISANWNWKEADGKPVRVVVYSGAPEVELLLNKKSLGIKKVGEIDEYQAVFDIQYEAGVLEAVGKAEGEEVSRARIQTSGEPAMLRLVPERDVLIADGKNLSYISVEVVDQDNVLVTDASISLKVTVTGAGTLAGFGSANPLTTDNYTTGEAETYRGKALAVVRAGGEKGRAVVSVESEILGVKELDINVL